MTDTAKTGYIIEFTRIGNSTKVSAIDPESGTEVSIVGPSSAPRQSLTQNAINKLHYVLEKNRQD